MGKGAAGWWGQDPHVDEMVSVSNEQVAQDAGFIEVPKRIMSSTPWTDVGCMGLMCLAFCGEISVPAEIAQWLTSARPPGTQAALCQGRVPEGREPDSAIP